ncbi:Type II secretion system protein E [Thalassoglobus neptunius]|uniref:Type II secretion system protein E n=1 Tax=Thalassoglobus neptunius TaxID=1938619 RepID=A0A5C5X3X2_9PLAN|nr:GspE/PulE family protein [Thalassoglobus neptunius]TWT57664.1 Type II secretion system protein E [Thalassoglobus neptunius]
MFVSFRIPHLKVILVLLSLYVAGGVLNPSALAQEPVAVPAPAPINEPVPEVADSTTETVERYSVPVDPFIRGNAIPSRPDYGLRVVQTPQVGFYLSLWKFGCLLVVFGLWIHFSKWVHDDGRDLHVRPQFWNGCMTTGGVIGIPAALLVPLFPVGFLMTLSAIGAPLGLYIRERNENVPAGRRVMTPEHIARWTKRQLAKVGINFGQGEKGESTTGPPIQFIGKTKTGRRDEARTRQVESSRGYVAAKELVYDAIQRRATDIHLEPKDDELGIRVRIDGVMYPAEPFDKAVGDAVINIFKVLCAIDITEKRRSQDGGFGAIVEGREIDFRVASQGTRHGEKLSMRILDQSNSVGRVEELGMRKQMQRNLENVIHQPHGLMLVCGPTGAGKSTTLYACLNDLDSSERNIITVEDPVEYLMPDVTQIEVNTKSGNTFGQALRSILRQDPDVVMIGEVRDTETAKIACQAANTGHMVFSTIHANDTITALYRLLDLEVEPFMISTSISAVLSQRLARRLCPRCRESYRPKAELLKAVGLPPEKVKEFFRPPAKSSSVCTKCGGLGYYGRVGVFELLMITERIRDMIRSTATMSAIRNEARKDGMLYMQEEGLRLVVRGVTSVDEITRVVK